MKTSLYLFILRSRILNSISLLMFLLMNCIATNFHPSSDAYYPKNFLYLKAMA